MRRRSTTDLEAIDWRSVTSAIDRDAWSAEHHKQLATNPVWLARYGAGPTHAVQELAAEHGCTVHELLVAARARLVEELEAAREPESYACGCGETHLSGLARTLEWRRGWLAIFDEHLAR